MDTEGKIVSDIESALAATPTTKSEQDNTKQVELAPEEQRKVLRMIDLRVTVVLGAISCISHMDRGNLAAAAIAGMNEDLQLQVGSRYNIVALIFFVPYLIFEFISSVLARNVGPRRLLMTICALWGAITIGSGLVRDWKQLAGLRVLLGVFEAAFFPLVVHLLSAWYTRYEVQKRYATYFLVTTILGAFSSIFIYGLLQMDGLAGLNGWRWVYIMEGILTVVLGLAITWFVVDFPDKARSCFKFLTDRQIDWVIYRLQEDRGDADNEPFSARKFFGAARHFPIWLYAIIFCCCTTVGHGVGFFLPLILRDSMGFSTSTTLCLLTPPPLFATAMMFTAGWIGDKYRIRGPILIFNSVLAIIGLVLLGWTKPSSVRYFSVFIILGGVMSNIPAAMAYQANNIRGQWVRAFGSATMVVGGGLGGVFGALAFGEVSLAESHASIGGLIGAKVLIIVVVLILTLFFSRENRLAEEGRKLIFNHEGFRYSI